MFKEKSNLHYTLGIMPKFVTCGGEHFHGLAPGRHVSVLTGPEIEPVISRAESGLTSSPTVIIDLCIFFGRKLNSWCRNALTTHVPCGHNGRRMRVHRPQPGE